MGDSVFTHETFYHQCLFHSLQRTLLDNVAFTENSWFPNFESQYMSIPKDDVINDEARNHFYPFGCPEPIKYVFMISNWEVNEIHKLQTKIQKCLLFPSRVARPCRSSSAKKCLWTSSDYWIAFHSHWWIGTSHPNLCLLGSVRRQWCDKPPHSASVRPCMNRSWLFSWAHPSSSLSPHLVSLA